MAKRKQAKQRPFNPAALDQYAVGELRPRMGPGETLWRYTVTVPLEEIRPRKRQKATSTDLENLEQMFTSHFGGFGRLPDSFGHGLRDPEKPEEGAELNANTAFSVLSSPLPEAEAYFRALRAELEEALG